MFGLSLKYLLDLTNKMSDFFLLVSFLLFVDIFLNATIGISLVTSQIPSSLLSVKLLVYFILSFGIFYIWAIPLFEALLGLLFWKACPNFLYKALTTESDVDGIYADKERRVMRCSLKAFAMETNNQVIFKIYKDAKKEFENRHILIRRALALFVVMMVDLFLKNSILSSITLILKPHINDWLFLPLFICIAAFLCAVISTGVILLHKDSTWDSWVYLPTRSLAKEINEYLDGKEKALLQKDRDCYPKPSKQSEKFF